MSATGEVPYAPVQALDYARLLFDGQPTEFRSIHPRTGATRHAYGTMEGEHDLDGLAQLNAQGYGVYAVVNSLHPTVEKRTQLGKGARNIDVTGVRALFVELDREESTRGAHLGMLRDAPLPPSLIVRSSAPHKLHGYWIMQPDAIPVHEFDTWQAALIARFGGDPACKNPSRVLRVPGFCHTKGEPILCTLVKANGQRYTRAEMLTAYPDLGEALEREQVRSQARAEAQARAAERKGAPTGDRTRKYALTALQGEHDRVASAAEGERNAALNRAAFSLGQLVGSGALDRAEVEDALRAAAQACGLADDEPRQTEATLHSGLEAGILEPRAVPSSGDDRTPFGRAAHKTATQGEPDLCAFARTDYGAAERLHAAYGVAFRYCGALGYLVWDGTRWKPDEGETLMRRMALETGRKLFAQAATLKDGDQRESWVKHSLSCERNAALKNAVDLVRTIPGVTVEAAQLDRDPMLFNVRNGTLDLRTGLLKDHDPADLITKVAGVDFDLMAECPRWLDFQQTICADDADLISFKQRAYGYSLTGMTSEDALFIAYGSGANGKSSELDAIGGILGDYGDTAQFETFAVKKNEGVRNDLAALMGARFVSASEGENRQRLAEGLVKQMTGGDVLKARFLNREFFSFKPEFKIWLATNHKPVIRGTDHGIWRRIRLVPYSVTISEAQRDKRLKQKLEAEKSGILNWLLEGCKIWLEHGLGDAEAVRKATESYRKESDALAEFISARCVLGETHSELAGSLYTAYQRWCEENGDEPFSNNLFGRMLTERGYAPGQARIAGSMAKTRAGICLTENASREEVKPN